MLRYNISYSAYKHPLGLLMPIHKTPHLLTKHTQVPQNTKHLLFTKYTHIYPNLHKTQKFLSTKSRSAFNFAQTLPKSHFPNSEWTFNLMAPGRLAKMSRLGSI